MTARSIGKSSNSRRSRQCGLCFETDCHHRGPVRRPAMPSSIGHRVWTLVEVRLSDGPCRLHRRRQFKACASNVDRNVGDVGGKRSKPLPAARPEPERDGPQTTAPPPRARLAISISCDPQSSGASRSRAGTELDRPIRLDAPICTCVGNVQKGNAASTRIISQVK